MKAFNKDIKRTVFGTMGRFLAIAGIAALGVGFYAGLRMTAPDMLIAADSYYDATHLMDLRITSSLGMSDADVEALRDIEGIEGAMPAYELDAMGTIGEERYVFRVHSMPESATQSDTSDGKTAVSDDINYVNRLILEEGRWPEAADECVISADAVMNVPVQLGDTVTLSEGTMDVDDTLAHNTYTIVGTVHSPYYVCSSNMGTSTIGGGTVDQFMYIFEDEFSSSTPYIEVFATVAGASAFESGSDEYQAYIDQTVARIEAIRSDREKARTDEVKEDAQRQVDEAAEEADAQLADAKATLDSAAAEIASGEAEIASGQQEYDEGVAALAEARESAYAQIAAARAEVLAMQEEYGAQYEEMAVFVPLLYQIEGTIYTMLSYVPQGTITYYAVEAAYETAVYCREMVESGVMQLAEALDLIEAGLAEIDLQESSAESQMADAQAELDSGAAELASAREELESGKAEYASGLAQYEEAAAEAEEKIAEAQSQVDDIADAEWYILDRTKNYGTMSFKMDAERVDKIASIFPFIFFLVAALVSLTTMTRMVDEERVLIGTYKALGYSRRRITGKYLFYAALASSCGCIVGLLILPKVLPFVIMNAYAIIYHVPSSDLPIDIPIALLSAGLGIGITVIATWGAASATLREKPASLMLPRAPKAGKRILLERIGFIWKRLGFSWKVTFRNLFLYKKRFLMTVIGIAGCTGLLLTGFGLRDALLDIIDLQFGELSHYETTISVKSGTDDSTKKEVENLAYDIDKDALCTWAYSVTMLISPGDRSDITVDVIVPEDPTDMGKVFTWRDRETHETYELTDAGALVAEKTATLMGVGVGDTIRLYEQDTTGMITETYYDVPIAAVVEHYAGNSVYLTSGLYEKLAGEKPEFTVCYCSVPDDKDVQKTFSEEARKIDGVKTVTFADTKADTYRTMLESVNLIVWVLIFSAGALAFIVLYNLININICERVREIATLKVLGFLPKEVSAYIYRETILLSIIGALVGLVLGIFLESFVITSAEVDQVMFGREIHAFSFVISFVLTIVFAALVMLVMHRKLKNVDMIESLKSIE